MTVPGPSGLFGGRNEVYWSASDPSGVKASVRRRSLCRMSLKDVSR